MAFWERQAKMLNGDGWFSCIDSTSIEQISDGNPHIASGTFGELTLAIDRTVNHKWRLVVLKTIRNSLLQPKWGQSQVTEPSLAPSVVNEIMALRHLTGHENIVAFLGLLPGRLPGSLSLVFDYNPMDLQMLFEKDRAELSLRIDVPLAKRMVLDMFGALEHCHANGILHRDVKPGNFLITREGRLQLCDFGLARPCKELIQVVHDSTVSTKDEDGLCTLWYRPPEVLLGGAATHPAVDMWSVGLVVAQLIEGGRPIFAGASVMQQIRLVVQALGTWSDARTLPDATILDCYKGQQQSGGLQEVVPRSVESKGLFSLLSKLVVVDPSQRLSCEEVLKHAWLTELLPQPASPSLLATTLVCEEEQLQPPLVLFSHVPGNDSDDSILKLAEERGLQVAKSRRNFLQKKSFQHDSKGRMSLQQAIQDLDT